MSSVSFGTDWGLLCFFCFSVTGSYLFIYPFYLYRDIYCYINYCYGTSGLYSIQAKLSYLPLVITADSSLISTKSYSVGFCGLQDS